MKGAIMKEPFEIIIKNNMTHKALAHLKFATYNDLSGAFNALTTLKDDGHIASYLDFVVSIPSDRLDEIVEETEG